MQAARSCTLTGARSRPSWQPRLPATSACARRFCPWACRLTSPAGANPPAQRCRRQQAWATWTSRGCCWVRGAQLNPVLGRSVNPLAAACANGHLAMVDLLLASGAGLEPRPSAERPAPVLEDNPLVAACAKGHEAVVQRLLDWGADVGAAVQGVTPLVAAAVRGHPSVVRLLLRRGAVPGCTTLEAARMAGNPGGALGLLVEHTGDLFLGCGFPELVEWVQGKRAAAAAAAAAASRGPKGRRRRLRPSAHTGGGAADWVPSLPPGAAVASGIVAGNSSKAASAATCFPPLPPTPPSLTAPPTPLPLPGMSGRPDPAPSPAEGAAAQATLLARVGQLLSQAASVPYLLLLLCRALIESVWSGLSALTWPQHCGIAWLQYLATYVYSTPRCEGTVDAKADPAAAAAAAPALPNPAGGGNASRLKGAGLMWAIFAALVAPARSALRPSAPQPGGHQQALPAASSTAAAYANKKTGCRQAGAETRVLEAAAPPQQPSASPALGAAAPAAGLAGTAAAAADDLAAAATTQTDAQSQADAETAIEAECKPVKQCAQCGAQKGATTKLSKCSGCQAVRYCSAECQLLHWREGGHKQRCVRLAC